MATLKKSKTALPDRLQKFGVDAAKLATLKPVSLSDAAIAKKLGVRTEALSAAFILSPNKPRAGKKFLSFYSPMMVVASPEQSNNIALFSSAFPGAVSPAIQVEFDAISAGKKHLVEFTITLNEPQKIYKFRVFQYPTATFQDIAISGSQSIAVLINPEANISRYGAEIMQLNTKAENCGWIFHSVKITSVG